MGSYSVAGPPVRNFDCGGQPSGFRLSGFSFRLSCKMLVKFAKKTYNPPFHKKSKVFHFSNRPPARIIPISTDARTLLGPRSAEFSGPLRGLAALLRGLQPPQLTC